MNDQNLKNLCLNFFIFVNFFKSWKSANCFNKIREIILSLFFNVYSENTFTIEIEDRRAPKSLVLVYFSNKFLIFFVKVCIFYDFLGVKTKHLHPLHKVTISVWYMKSATFYLSGFNWQKSIQNLQKKCQLKWLRRSFFLAKANQVSTKKEFFEFRNFFLQHSRIQNPDLDPQIRIKLERILSTETQSAKKGII